MVSKDLIEELKNEDLGIETIFDLIIKSISITYVLSGLWASVAVAFREYKTRPSLNEKINGLSKEHEMMK